ncbi:MAG: protein translocase subunit SecF [Microgenomates group bacterium]
MNWMKYKWLYFLISGLVLIPGFYSLFKWGLRPSIDFTGGTILEYKFSQNLEKEKLKEVFSSQGVEIYSFQETSYGSYLLRLPPIDNQQKGEIEKKIKENLKVEPEELRFETVGPILGKELLRKTIIAIFLASGFILLYVAWRFKDKKFGICAILAMFHDTFVLLGSFSLLGHFLKVEVDTLFVTALLTTLSFSVHDTVVVYDRIRESQKIFSKVPFEKLVDKAVTETLTRSLNNSLTIIFMLTALFLLGGETIRWFVVALLIGTISGTYSSTFTAAPLLVVWDKIKSKKS